MDSVLDMLIKKQHPEYTEDEVESTFITYCEENAKLITLYRRYYQFRSGTEQFEVKRNQIMSLIDMLEDK